MAILFIKVKFKQKQNVFIDCSIFVVIKERMREW